MKKAMSNVDVAAMVVELKDKLVGGHVGKAYQLSSDTIWLSVQSPAEGRLDLLIEAGRRIHLTRKERKASKTPPQFPTMLRNRLSGGRIVDILQFDLDRVVEIVVERGGANNYLIVELFPKGSMILLDESRRILSMLRKMIFRGRRMAAGEEYLYHTLQLDPRTIGRLELSGLLATSEQDLIRTIVRCMNMGGIYGEEICLQAGLDKNKPAADLDTAEIDRLHKALADVFMPQTIEPHIVLAEGQPVDVLPKPLKLYDGLERQYFQTFSDALDAFFVDKVEGPKQSPLERRIELQRKAIEEFATREKELVALGEFVYQRYGEIEQLLNVISDAKAKGFSYVQIRERIRASSLPQAQIIRCMEHTGEIQITLDSVELDINAGLTVPQNAQRYYEQAKEMARKAKGAKEALAITEELKASKAEPRKTRQAIHRRKPKWYERFRWFTSSDGFLVIGGRDSDTNEEIYSKYLEKRDLAFHTDAPGAPLTVIKTKGQEAPDATLQEAAQFAVSYSSIWKGGLAAGDCYMVEAMQVTKTPEHGEFLKKGAFVIRGERRYFRDTPLGLAIGITDGVLIGGPTSAINPDADPRLEIEPGEYNADDLGKRIYRMFSDKIDDRAYLKSIASIDQIVQFLPPGGSRIKENSNG
jgi:predicted ribosome quality control (RQC) complex YloA/Tae2 family protein